jgi:hypothetical protein
VKIPQADRIQVTFMPRTGEALVYDLQDHSIVHELVDYGLFLRSSRQLEQCSVQLTTWALARFWSHLVTQGKTLSEIDQALLVAYRDSDLKRVKTDRSHRDSDRAAKATINGKLSMILHWLVWLQWTGAIAPDSIGVLGCRVEAEAAKSNDLILKPGIKLSSSLFYRDAGRGANRPYVAREVVDAAAQIIMDEATDPYVAFRNITFNDLGSNSGFRRGSMTSLKITQFPSEELESWTDDQYEVKPEKQKLNYENTFSISIDLALRVSEFIEGPRAELVKRLGVDRRKTQDRIFLSSTTGEPMSDRGMTQSLRKAMRAAGTKKGQVVHVLRGLFLSEQIEAEGGDRARRGLDTSTASIAAAVAVKAGQRNPNSLNDYVSAEQSRIAARRRSAERKANKARTTSGDKK